MKYLGLPCAVWALYKKSFKKNLAPCLKVNEKDARVIMKKAKVDFKKILFKIPEFEKGDSFAMNIISCAMLISILLNLGRRPTLEELTSYYDNAMRTKLTASFCEMKGKEKFTEKSMEEIKNGASLKAAIRNMYSWNYEFISYPDNSGYEARFTHCGICVLMKEYGFFDLVPAMCHLDYTINELCKTVKFIREYTLASGGPYCDCGYKKLNKEN